MSTHASIIEGMDAANLDAIYSRNMRRAQLLHRRIDSAGVWSDLTHTQRGALGTLVSVADALAQQDADGVVYDTARKLARRDSTDAADAWIANVVQPVLAVAQGRQDSFSSTSAGVPAWYNAQKLSRDLLVPQVPIERAGVRVMSDFDPGANSLYQKIREYVGRAGRLAPAVGRPGSAARVSFREGYVNTDLFWYGLEAVGTDFTRMENAFHGTDEQRVLDASLERGIQNTLDDIFFQGVGVGLKPFGIATHPAMLATVGDTISPSTTAVQIANIISDGIARMADDTNGAAICRRVKIGGTIWRRLAGVIQADTMTGALAALKAQHPGVEFEPSYRLKGIESGVDGILYLADSDEGLASVESSPMLFSWSEGPRHINMVAVKSGGAYPQMPIYSRLDRHAVS